MGDLNDDDDPMSMWDHKYSFAGKTIMIHEDYDAGLGGTLFDGALCLCNYLAHLHKADPAVFEGKRAVELGAGCGLPGILIGSLGADITITDIEQTVELMEENIESNDGVLCGRGKARELDWTVPAQLEGMQGPYDIVLAADTVYSELCIEPLLSVLLHLCGPDTVVLFAHPAARVPAASELWWGRVLAEDSPFVCEKVPPEHFGVEGQQFSQPTKGLFRLRLRPPPQQQA